MIGPHSSELWPLEERILVLEAENQRLRELLGDKADNESFLQARIATLKSSLDALRGEMQCRLP